MVMLISPENQIMALIFRYVFVLGWTMINFVQVGNVPSTLWIVDYSHGFTGSAHDALAFVHTAAAQHPDWLFDGEEFAWVDSAYSVTHRTIPFHKKPASLCPENAAFD